MNGICRLAAGAATALLASSCRAPAAASSVFPDGSPESRAPADPGPAARDPRSLAAAGYASVVCSAVFLQGRDPAEAGRNSTYFVVNDVDRPAVDRVEVDRAGAEVRASMRGGPTRVARVVGDAGCVTLPEGQAEARFDPGRLGFLPLPPSSGPWPTDLAIPGRAAPDGRERAAMERAVAPWFDDPEALTTAVVVVHRGQVVVERYGMGATPDTLLDASAIGKSVLATLAGLLAREGLIRLEAAVPIPEWSGPGDPRGAIRLVDLLGMSSGLSCSSPFDDDWEESKGYTDSQFVYTGGIDAVAYAIARPLAKSPGTEGRYANCGPLVATAAMERALSARGESVIGFARRALYDRIGARRMLTQPDPWGHPLFIGYHFATARDLARLGLLYARDGQWRGARLLPEGFVRTVSTPAPAWKPPVYGVGFWLPAAAGLPVPSDSLSMTGFGGQSVLVVPSLDLVVVRTGHPRGGAAAGKARKSALPAILDAARQAP